MKKAVLISVLVFVLYLALVVGIGFLVHLEGARLWLFIAILGSAGLIGLIIFLVWKKKTMAGGPTLEAGEVEADALAQLVRAADAKLKGSPGGAKSLAAMPLVYVLGDENSGKTQTVLQSGIDAELLSGAVHRDGIVAPTQLANLWYTSQAAVVEAGGAMLKQPGLWQRLVRSTQPNKLGTAISKGGLQPTRAAVLCISIERITAANSADSVRALGQMLNDRLRLLSQTLGISLPVYVVFTKLDTIPSFADYSGNLTDEEVRQPLGALLVPIDATSGMYADQATSQAAARFDELCYSLAEYRLEVLSRGGQADRLAKAYEFPRELRKLRGPIVDMLVEAGRPSQLGVNPFLRGFYFIGMRAKTVEETAPAQAAAAPPPAADAGATRIFSFNAAKAAPAPAQAVRTTKRVPQWCFLPYLFPTVLHDRSALDTSRASTKVNVVKRILIGSLAACLFLYFIALTISYLNNSSLENRLRTAAATSTASVSHGDPATFGDLQELEKLRAVFAEIAEYHKDGAPFSYRWGLYNDDRLYRTACEAYGSHFRTLLLTPTQANILAHMTSLPAAPQPTDEYIATYRPLRAYLITTSNPEKSTTDFLPDALQTAWAGTRQVPADVADLSLAQFKTYAATLAEPNSCMAQLGGAPRGPAVQQARAYLSHFQGLEAVYNNMKAAADKKFPGFRFNDKFPGSARYVVDQYFVEGAFTRGGYDFMQNAFAHPEPYTSGEEWVLGPQTANAIDLATVRAQLPPRYQADFINTWRTYLKSAHVVPSGSWADAKEKLNQLDSPASALGELFQLISQNTDVPNPAIMQAFQAPQTVVAPKALLLPQDYLGGLSGLESAIAAYLAAPQTNPPDPNAAAGIIQAATGAEGAVNKVRNGFVPPDPAGQMDSTSEALLMAPIRSVEAQAKSAGKGSGGGGGGGGQFCAQLTPILNKFPFNPDSHEDATSQDLALVFQPEKGLLPTFTGLQKQFITLLGNQYIPAQNAQVNPAFLQFINKLQTMAPIFYPPGGAAPKLEFTLTQESTPNLAPATLEIDGNTLAAAGNTKSFTWTSNAGSVARLSASGASDIPARGPWSVFHFAYDYAKHPAPNKLEFLFQVNGRTTSNDKGVPLDYKFDAGGTGAPLLNPSYMHGLHCVAKVEK